MIKKQGISMVLTIIIVIFFGFSVSAEYTTEKRNYFSPELTTIVDVTALNHDEPYKEEKFTDPATGAVASTENADVTTYSEISSSASNKKTNVEKSNKQNTSNKKTDKSTKAPQKGNIKIWYVVIPCVAIIGLLTGIFIKKNKKERK